MTAVKSGLMIIDQHRADVRIRYEHYLEACRQHTMSTQRVLFPEVIQFSPSEDLVVQQILPELLSLGFDISSLGGGSYALNGIPATLDDSDPVLLIRNMVADAIEKGSVQGDELYDALALSLARHAAISYGQILSNEEMERLVNDLFSCSNVNYTPDGHSILSILPQHDIDRLFGT